MKHPLLLLLTGLFAALPCAAQTAVFDPASGLVDIPCVATFDGSALVGTYAPYHVQLRRIGTSAQFAVERHEPIAYHSDCSGFFDTSNGVYTDSVNIGDDAYDVRMRRGADNRFTLESAQRRGPASSSLWVASNGSNTVYLAGAIHLLRAEDYPLPRAYDVAYAQADALYFEIDLDDPNENGDSLSAAQTQAMLLDPQGRTLSDVLMPETWSALGSYMQREGLSLEAVDGWSTQMLIHALGYREVEFHHGFSADGVDAFLAERAMRDGKPIHGLETTAFQTHVMHTLHEGRENALVQEYLADVASGNLIAEFDVLIEAWRRGDAWTIERNSVQPLRERSEADYRLLQVDRNRAWLTQVEAMLSTPATEMVVVGVAHMAGEDGLITLLRQRGYSVEKF